MFMAQNLVGLIGKFGYPAKISRKGGRKPRWEEESVWRSRSSSAMLNVVGHFEILCFNLVMRKEVSVWRRGR